MNKLILLAAIFLTLMPMSAEALEGFAQVDVIDGKSFHTNEKGEVVIDEEPVLQKQTPTFEEKPPAWIKGKVYSHDEMLMYSFWQILPFKKRFRWAIPNRITHIRLAKILVRHWEGYKPEGECPVTCIPLGNGNFKFHHARADGPHGYIARVGETADGFPRYRYWFDVVENSGSQ